MSFLVLTLAILFPCPAGRIEQVATWYSGSGWGQITT